MKKLILLFLLTLNAKIFTEKAFINEITNLTDNLIFFSDHKDKIIILIEPKAKANQKFKIKYKTFYHDQESHPNIPCAIEIPIILKDNVSNPSFSIGTYKLNSYKNETISININFFKAISSKTGDEQFGFVNTNSIFQKIKNCCSKKHSHNLSLKISWISFYNCFKIESECQNTN